VGWLEIAEHSSEPNLLAVCKKQEAIKVAAAQRPRRSLE
jgi:hypothetical protein